MPESITNFKSDFWEQVIEIMNTLCPHCSSYSADHTGFQYNSKGANPKGQTIEMQLGKKKKKKEEPDWAHIF